MDLTNLFESETSDRADRLQAVMVHTQIRQWLERNAERRNNGLLTQDGSGPLAGAFLITPEMVDLDEDYPDLMFVLSPNTPESPEGSLGFYKNGIKVMFIHCLIGPHDPRHVSTRWGGMKKVFVHEFMHYLLRHRGRDRSGAAQHAEDKDYTSYFNNADETNSYYQEAAHQMSEVTYAVCNASPKHTLEWARKTTPELVTYVKDTFVNKDFLRYLNESNMRALNKRLARFIEETIRPMLQRAIEKHS